ncbi:histamine H2 receptor-like [Oculina patagonica]
MSQPREDTRSLPTVAVHTSILVLTIALSLAGNTLVCLAFYRNRRLRTITNFYVLSLSIIGLLIATFAFPFTAIASVLRQWPFNDNFCQFNGFLSYYIAGVSLGTLALTAVNRYFCVVKPQLYPILFTKKKTVFSIAFVWLFTLSAGLTVTLVTPISFAWHPENLFCPMTGLRVDDSKVIASVFVAVFIVFPMCVILFCYGSVYRAIRRHNVAVNPSLQEATSQGTVSAHEIQASRVLLAAVIGFCVCWTPAIIISILKRVTQLQTPSLWLSFYTLFAASSSWINPIIYGVMNRAMRKEFLKLLRCQSQN